MLAGDQIALSQKEFPVYQLIKTSKLLKEHNW